MAYLPQNPWGSTAITHSLSPSYRGRHKGTERLGQAVKAIQPEAISSLTSAPKALISPSAALSWGLCQRFLTFTALIISMDTEREMLLSSESKGRKWSLGEVLFPTPQPDREKQASLSLIWDLSVRPYCFIKVRTSSVRKKSPENLPRKSVLSFS